MADKKRKNESPAWLKELEDALECPVCCETFKDPPIYLCENMHGMCSKCKTSLMQKEKDEAKCCPICRGQLTEKRSFHLEKILEKLPKSECKHDDCYFKRSEKAVVEKHEEECKQRPLTCGMCDEQVSLSKFTWHLSVFHWRWTGEIVDPMTFGKATDVDYKWTDHSFHVHPLRVKNSQHQFYLNEAPLDHNCVLLWVSCSLPSTKAADYEFTVTISGSKHSLSGKRQCVSCDVSHSQVEKSMNGILWDKELIREAESHGFKLKITKC